MEWHLVVHGECEKMRGTFASSHTVLGLQRNPAKITRQTLTNTSNWATEAVPGHCERQALPFFLHLLVLWVCTTQIQCPVLTSDSDECQVDWLTKSRNSTRKVWEACKKHANTLWVRYGIRSCTKAQNKSKSKISSRFTVHLYSATSATDLVFFLSAICFPQYKMRSKCELQTNWLAVIFATPRD